jgi:endonuclease YncB( thermonuclease family)
MVGVDAPEVSPSPLSPSTTPLNATPSQRSHFGKPAQAYSDEALAWLKEQIHGRRLKCQLFKRDQYGRIVALPLIPHHRWWPRRSATRNLPLEMVRAGWGTVYTGAGAKYGGWGQAAFHDAQAEAQ